MSEKKLEISVLCDVYGELLGEKQREALELYYNEDLSLSEIAENTGISRQGVRGQIKYAEAQLTEYESKLGLSEKYRFLAGKLAEMAASEKVKNDEGLMAIIDEIQTEFNI